MPRVDEIAHQVRTLPEGQIASLDFVRACDLQRNVPKADPVEHDGVQIRAAGWALPKVGEFVPILEEMLEHEAKTCQARAPCTGVVERRLASISPLRRAWPPAALSSRAIGVFRIRARLAMTRLARLAQTALRGSAAESRREALSEALR